MATETTTFGRVQRDLHQAPDFARYYASPAANALFEEVRDALPGIDVLSLDVFDTLLLRDHRSELERFTDIAEAFAARLAADDPAAAPSARACLVARVMAAATAYRVTAAVDGCREGRHADILAETVALLRLPPGQAATLAEAELAVETAQLRLSAFAMRLVELARHAGKRVVLISDMYYPASHIATLLAACGCDPAAFDAIWSSADTVRNKRSGTLYPVVAAELAVPPGRILHLGDSFGSDFAAAVSAGLQAIHLPVPRALARRRHDSHHATLARLFGEDVPDLPIAAPAL